MANIVGISGSLRKYSFNAGLLRAAAEAVPEDKRSIIPDLPPAKKIAWLQSAFKMDFFADAKAAPLDTKKPGDQKPTNFDNMTPQAIMAKGYKTK